MISILIPCKNAEAYLNECLSSIIAQSYQNWEVIAVNDHSQDQSEEILRDFAAIDHRIKVYNNTGAGIIESLRMAFQESRGHLITRMDADDIMGIHRLEIMAAQLKESGIGHIATGQVKYFSSSKSLGNGYIKYEKWLNGLSKSGKNFSEIYKECVIPSPCWMLYRSDLNMIGAFESSTYPEDYDLVFRMYAHGLKVIPATDEVLLRWRDYAARSSRTDPHYSDNRFLDIKINYFIQLEYDIKKPLFLWGAGKKGKILAKSLITRDIAFHWITGNERKIGKDIYGIQLISPSILKTSTSAQLILMVANPAEQEEMKKIIPAKSDNYDIKQYWFC